MSKIFNNALFEAKERESAVSPVVGVMLMLVVTIIIAATVSAFAGGLVGSADKAPQAAFDVNIKTTQQWGYINPTLAITHLGGDPIDTSRTKLVTSWTNRTTKEINYRATTKLADSPTEQEYMSGLYVNLSLVNANANSSYYKYQEPYFVLPKDMPADGQGEESSLWFGSFILHAGETMKAEASLSDYETHVYYDYELSTNGYKDYSVIKNAKLLSGKDIVNVKLIDIPTGNVIFDKDIPVMEV